MEWGGGGGAKRGKNKTWANNSLYTVGRTCTCRRHLYPIPRPEPYNWAMLVYFTLYRNGCTLKDKANIHSVSA